MFGDELLQVRGAFGSMSPVANIASAVSCACRPTPWTTTGPPGDSIEEMIEKSGTVTGVVCPFTSWTGAGVPPTNTNSDPNRRPTPTTAGPS